MNYNVILVFSYILTELLLQKIESIDVYVWKTSGYDGYIMLPITTEGRVGI